MKFNLKFQDLKPSVQAEIHNEIMEKVAGGKHPEHLPDPYFMEASNKADEALKNFKLVGEVKLKEE